METLNAIRTRRSIRAYTGEPVSEATLRRLLSAAFSAPTAMDERPWHFLLLRDSARLEALAAAMPGCEMLREATLGFLICGDEQLEKVPGFWIQDCAACAENVLLAAHAEGLGAVWLALYPLDDRGQAVRDELGVPPEIQPFALLAMGHPAESLPPEDRYDAARVHLEHW